MELCYSCTNPSTLSREMSRYIPLFVKKYENNYNRSMQIQCHLTVCCLTGGWCEIYGNNHREALASSKLGPMNLILLEQSLNVDWPVNDTTFRVVSKNGMSDAVTNHRCIYFCATKVSNKPIIFVLDKGSKSTSLNIFCLYDLPTKSLNPNHL